MRADAGEEQSGGLEKCPTGIRGLDEITFGGLPRGRPTLIAGGAGSGKTLLGMEFLVRGARELGENGVFMAFEETEAELATNVHSLGFDVDDLVASNKLVLDHVYIERSEIEVTGEYDLEGLFVRLGSMVDQVAAKRVVLDSLEALFGGLDEEGILRAELRRLFRWLKERGLTAIITAEQGRDGVTRLGLEEYVSDCVILLDHRVDNQVATRRLRILKYRGSRHGTNEYPAMIDDDGLSVLPISSLALDYPVSSERISTGIAPVDEMLSGKGYYRGSSILVSGTAGTGKSSLAGAFVDAACSRGERALYFAFEESPSQIKRNMASIGLDLERWEREGSLRFRAARSTLHGLEQHLGAIHSAVVAERPTVVVVDPVSNLTPIGTQTEIVSMLTRVVDYLKQNGITALFTSLNTGRSADIESSVGISSMMDTWLVLRQREGEGDRHRLLHILKSRGMAHSSRVRVFRLTDHGIEIDRPESRSL